MVILQNVDKKGFGTPLWNETFSKKSEEEKKEKKMYLCMFSLIKHPLSIHSSFTIHPQHHCYNFRMLMNAFVCVCGQKCHVFATLLQISRGGVKESQRRRWRRKEEIRKQILKAEKLRVGGDITYISGWRKMRKEKKKIQAKKEKYNHKRRWRKAERWRKKSDKCNKMKWEEKKMQR